MKKLYCATAAVATMLAVPTTAIAGNGAPSGQHYSLNIIGVDQKSNMPENLDAGHVIFVKLWGNDTKIELCNSDAVGSPCEGLGFQVLDKNGTDGTAAFALPHPDPDEDGTTVYSVFARALGSPSGSADMTTCADDPDDGMTDPVCSVNILTLDATDRPSKFENVSKYLLYVYANIDADADLERVPLFGTGLTGFYWDYDNRGLKLAQLRFYPCSTTVPPATDPGGAQNDAACFD